MTSLRTSSTLNKQEMKPIGLPAGKLAGHR